VQYAGWLRTAAVAPEKSRLERELSKANFFSFRETKWRSASSVQDIERDLCLLKGEIEAFGAGGFSG
jgi:hypothetical protein